MWRHAESNDLLLFAVLLELKGVMALMSVNNKQPVLSYSTLLCMGIEVFQPLETNLICGPTVLRDRDQLILRYSVLFVLGREVMAPFKDNMGRNSPSCRINALNDRSLLAIAWLDGLWSSSLL